MSTQVAFLRAINVGGHGVVKMTELRDAFSTAGCRNVRTYIQSGNVVFDAPEKGRDALFKKVRARLADLPGSEPGVCFRTLDDIDALISSDPFRRCREQPGVKLYVTFPADTPRITPAFPLALPKEAVEAVAMKGRDVLVVSRPKPNGSYGFPNVWIEKVLGVPATTRSWSTVSTFASFARPET